MIKQRNDAKKSEETSTNERLKEILAILNKYDYDDGITPEIVVGILQDLGPTFVKIGQIASQQSESITPEYCDALSKLRSSVAPMDIETVYAQIEKYLGMPASEAFASFDEKPLGSASIGQVHKAELKDGTVVAVKVRRPGVVDTVARDFALIVKILDLGGKFAKEDSAGLDLKAMVEELEHTSKQELDFTNEARNLDRFYENNNGRPGVTSPKCYRELTNEAILTEDFVSGNEVSDTDYLATLDDEERRLIAELVADNFASQVLTDGFYHADPHSGNVLIQPIEAVANNEAASGDETADDQPQLPLHGIEWIDFGMMGTLTSRDRQTLIDLVTAVVLHDAYGLKRTVLRVATPRGDIDHGALLEMCENMCDQYTGGSAGFGDFNLGDLLGALLGGLQDENYKVEPFLTNLSRGIIAAEGTIKTLSPNVNILNAFTSKVNFAPDTALSLSSEEIEAMAPQIALKAVELLGDLTTKATNSLDMLEKGQIRTRTDLGFEEKGMKLVERMTRYVVRAILAFGLFIGSCLLCTVPASAMEVTPLFLTFPVVGSIGYAVSVFFAYNLFKDMKKGE